MQNKKLKWVTPELVTLTNPKATGTVDPDCAPLGTGAVICDTGGDQISGADCGLGSGARLCGNGGSAVTTIKPV